MPERLLRTAYTDYNIVQLWGNQKPAGLRYWVIRQNKTTGQLQAVQALNAIQAQLCFDAWVDKG